jgi:amino acid transporter
VAGVRAGQSGHLACNGVHFKIGALFSIAGFALHLHGENYGAAVSAASAWSLLLAYIATGASVIGGFYHYGNLLLRDATGHGTSAVFLALLVTAISTWIAWRDVKLSARIMLWIEAISVSLILIVVIFVLARTGFHLDREQLHLRGMTGSGPPRRCRPPAGRRTKPAAFTIARSG